MEKKIWLDIQALFPKSTLKAKMIVKSILQVFLRLRDVP